MKKNLKILIIILITLTINIKIIKAEEIPKLFLKGDITNMIDKNDERKLEVSYISTTKNLNAYATIKIQGSSSIYFPKKNYTLKLYKNNNYNKKLKVDIGLGEESKYHLKANWIDKTYARNIVTARIASKLQERYNLFIDTPNNGLTDGIPIEIYINDEFLGLYTLNIPKDEWMFNMDKDNPNHLVFAAENYSDSTYFKTKANFTDWDLEVGPQTEETLNKFNRIFDFIQNSTDEEFKTNFNDYINLDAMLNYYIMLEFAELIDNRGKNLLMVTYDGEIWYPTLYDLDTSWGTNWNGTGLNNYNDLTVPNTSESLLLAKFQRNFKNEIANRYFEFRKDILTKEFVINEFEKFINSILISSIEKENNKWNNNLGADINQIKEFLDVRIPIIDKIMYELYDLNHNIDINYSTKKLTLKPIKVTLSPSRNDIIILKNGKKLYDYNYTITKNGKYTFEYIDWYENNLGTFTINISWIIPNFVIYTSILLIVFILSLILTICFNKKITKPKPNNNQEEKANNKNIKKKNNEQLNVKKEKTNNKKDIINKTK